jgi:hypothetical protein
VTPLGSLLGSQRVRMAVRFFQWASGYDVLSITYIYLNLALAI